MTCENFRDSEKSGVRHFTFSTRIKGNLDFRTEKGARIVRRKKRSGWKLNEQESISLALLPEKAFFILTCPAFPSSIKKYHRVVESLLKVERSLGRLLGKKNQREPKKEAENRGDSLLGEINFFCLGFSLL